MKGESMSRTPPQLEASVPSEPVHVRFDRFDLDEANASLRGDDVPVTLAPTPFAVLCALVRKPGALLTKNALLDEVWGHRFVSESVLKTVISELRSVLGDDARHPRFIETVSRRGYRFIAATSTLSAGPASAADTAKPSLPEAPSFVGRGAALAWLRRAWQAASGGKRSIVWVAGEAGVGKTTLIERFVAGLGDVACARGQCVDQYGAGESYLPVLDALAELCKRDPGAARLLRDVAPTWLLQLPWLSRAEERDALRRELAGVGPERMLREMGAFFDRYTENRPLLLVTEDLHWSDHATIQLIDHLARRRGSARLMWIGSFRLADIVAHEHPLKLLRNELRLHGLCDEIVLDSFSEQEVGDYVAVRAPSLAGDEAFVRALHARTDGLPLFLAYVMNEMTTRDWRAAGSEPAAVLARMAIPENLEAVIAQYIGRLAPEQRELLCAAAVCGLEFRSRTVAYALDRDPTVVDQACRQLAGEQLWLLAPNDVAESGPPDLPYAFRHALVRQVLYHAAAPLARADLHRRVGRALERERSPGVPVAPRELAQHFDRGSEPMTALRYYAEAADAAMQQVNAEECVGLTERGLALLEQVPAEGERHALEITLAKLRGVSIGHLRGVTSAEAKAAFQRAYARLADVPRHPRRGLVLHGLAMVLCMRAEYAEALDLAERAGSIASANDDPVLLPGVCTVQAEVHALQGRPAVARHWAERGLQALAASETPSPHSFFTDPQVTLQGLLAVQLVELGQVEAARAQMCQAERRARELGQPMAQMVAMWLAALLEVRLADAAAVAALADGMRTLVDRFALAQGRTACQWFGGWAEARMGRAREGYRRIRDAYEQNARLGMLAGASETRGYAVEALVLAGDWDAAEEELAAAFEFANGHGERVYLVQLLLLQAVIEEAQGQSAAAAVTARRALEEARAREAPWLELIALIHLCERAYATAAERDALARLVAACPEAPATQVVSRARALISPTAPL